MRASRKRSAKRLAQVAALAAAGVLSFTACGSDPTTGGGSGNAAEPGGSTSGSASGASLACPSGKLNAEGSTAQANAITQAISAYGSACSNKATVEYNATGSGDGIKNFTGGLVDFAGSDAALDEDEAKAAEKRCEGNPAWNLPMVAGPVALVYNLDGVDKLVLTPKVSSEIFTGKIKKWNDKQIADLNSGVKLPDEDITVFFRSDESGTTQNVETFLKEAGEGAWTKEPSKSWGGVGEGKNKSSGIAQGISQTKNSISYVEWSYAKNSKLSMAQLDNGNGPVELTAENVGKAVGGAEVVGEGNDLKLQLKYSDTEAGAYPLLLVTYEIVCSKGLDADKTKLEKDFLSYMASPETQTSLEQLGYAPLPEELQGKVSDAVDAIS
ncbi:phosphate ABC transporter substrate-binding protein PstS [Microlunatus soli]|uniref:Phosphate-binding protein n=1 Tax=Microlunatus soli TaxID=630515 RepID=A0A1H1S850_9ACTN|nr:phosphate ABC transporter substrate-binding protein PstS [Microlunatus soli]SDS44063.1 phosphate ABC transporter substrate-binding protein, PhoT family [Microlunatus soli]